MQHKKAASALWKTLKVHTVYVFMYFYSREHWPWTQHHGLGGHLWPHTVQLKKVPLTTLLSLTTYDCFTLLSLVTGRNKGRRGIHTQRSCRKLSGHQVSLMILTPHLPPAMNFVVLRCTSIAKLNDLNRLCRAWNNV